MDIKLIQLTMDNFKGCRRLALDLRGRGASIYGDNATGKTTIYDAFTWLLFGKDSRGRGEFDIKPLNAAGEVADHGAVTSVEAVLSVDGGDLRLKRTYFERWSVKRGSGEATFDGHTSEFFVDGVPLKKGEYEKRIGELVDEDLFRMLTNVTWFCEGMDWRKRWDMLFQVCRLPDDLAIMAGEPRFQPLAAAMGGLSLEDYKRKLQAQRKGLNGDRNTIPARLDEVGKSVEELAGLDFPALRAQREEASASLERLRGELLKLGHGALLVERRNQLAAARNEVQYETERNACYRQSQRIPVEDRRPALREAMDKAEGEAARWSRLAGSEESAVRKLEDMIQACRDAWAAENARTFLGERCPTCGQVLPVEALKSAMAKFEAEKELAKGAAVARANEAKEALAAAEGRRAEYIQAAAAAEKEADRLRAELEAYRPEEPPEVQDLPGHRERLAKAEEHVRALAAQVAELEEDTAAIRKEITARIVALQNQVEGLDQELAKEAMLSFARERGNKLREEAAKLAAELGQVDKLLYLCEEFARYKVRFVEDSVNSRFRLARWKLYQEQVNGGLADCCEAAYGGVPYGTLNNGMRINLGLDVIRTLSEHHGLRAPLMIDNAESVTALQDAGTQVIRLVVSKDDKELRIEYEA